MSAGKSSNSWTVYLPFLIGIGLALPVYEEVQTSLKPGLGSIMAFTVAVLAALAVSFPAFIALSWVIQREQRGQTTGLAPMVYRPAVLPVWVFLCAFIKNFPEATKEYVAWAFLAWLLVLLSGAVALQRWQGRPWSWWIAVPVGAILALVAMPAAGFVVWLVAPEQMQPAAGLRLSSVVAELRMKDLDKLPTAALRTYASGEIRGHIAAAAEMR